MRILVAEDEPISRRILEVSLTKWDHEVVSTRDGQEAWNALLADDAPRLCILDWMMPGLDGVDVCRRIRASRRHRGMYVILLTARSGRNEIVSGLRAGADDYLTKPFNQQELCARIAVGERILRLQAEVNSRVTALEEALAQIKTLEGLLPICMHCHKIREGEETWHRLEEYIRARTDADFTHALCPDCFEEHYPDESLDQHLTASL